jgi:aspartate ammonia-lyase
MARQTLKEINPPTTTRVEKDSLGQLELPARALYGINTSRSLDNFPLSGRPIASWSDFVHAFAIVKQAAARANHEIGALTAQQADAISVACEEVKAGKHDSHLVVDTLEGSGGTSTNMNFNEVIANAAAMSSQQALADYSFIHPNDHVNMGQSTNDVLPTAMKVAIYHAMADTPRALSKLADAFSKKRDEYASLLRLGRTCLQDAQPMTYGQAFGGYEAVIRRHAEQLETLRKQFLTLPLGGTAIGTGFGSRPGYKAAVYRHLSSLMGVQVKPAANAFDGMQNMDACARLSAELRNTANTMSKVSTDFITLSSGPGGGIGEITLPAVHAGSSIMPGKLNPVIPMAVCQVAIAITGNDASIAMACHQGMLEINHFEMVVCDRLLDSIRLLAGATEIFSSRCVEGIVVNKEISHQHLLASSALATAFVPALGYARVSSIVRAALAQQRPFLELAIEDGFVKEHEVVAILERSVRTGDAPAYEVGSGTTVETSDVPLDSSVLNAENETLHVNEVGRV